MNDELLKRIAKLSQENYSLVKDIKIEKVSYAQLQNKLIECNTARFIFQQENQQLKDRINKAIEYIEKCKHLNWYVESCYTNDLLEILKEDNKEE